MTNEQSPKELPPGDAKPHLYKFLEFNPHEKNDTYCTPIHSSADTTAPTTTSSSNKTFRNIHCVGLNCYNCVWDQSIPPLITVNPGEICTVECLDASGGQVDPHTSTSDDLTKFDLSKVNPLHGPIYIQGAEPGDTLEVEVVKLQPGSWGWTGIIPNFGLLSSDDTDDPLADADLREKPFLQIWKLDGDTGYTEMFEGQPDKPNIRIPIQPFCGEMGVAPKNPGPHSQVPPDDHGGNVDCKHMTQGSKVYFPVFVKGALFSIGDGHAAQGDGEVCGTAIECPMKVDVRFRVHKQGTKPVEQMEYLTPGPLDTKINTGQWYFTTGIAPDLMVATKLAIKRMISYLNREYGLTKHEAMVLCSVAVDLKLHEVVDTPNWNVGAGLPLSIFHPRTQRVCVIGGTGCAGTPTVEAFLDAGCYQVTVLSRGGSGDGHFGREANDGQNQAKQKRMKALKDKGVIFVACDRMNEREKFRQILAESNFHVIVDYWAMTPDHVQDVIDGTAGTELQSYIFISTNMVYKGGPEAFDVRNNHWLKEYDVDVVEYAKYCPDSYGGRKVFCEALLKKAHDKSGFPYTALRMPSVIGPQADWRWSKLQEWVAKGNPIDPHGGVGNQFRIVYSGDVGKACYLIATHTAKTAGQAINFCQDETPTYAEFLECLSSCLGVTTTPASGGETVKTITEVSPFSNYEGQWILDTTKAQTLLGWKTTPMKEWMQKTVDWHKENNFFTGGDLPVADKAIR